MDTISILIPVYNVESYLRTCLDSVIHQTYPQLEIILVDDGSTDDSAKICDEYAKADPRISVFHKPNEGLLLTRRQLFRYATGKYVLCLDSDDWLELNAVETVVKLAQSSGAQIVYFGHDRVSNDGTVLEEMQPYAQDGIVFKGDEMQIPRKDLILTGVLGYIWDKLIDRSLISQEDDKNPIYQEVTLGEDKIQIYPIFARADSLAYCAQCLHHYRCSSSSITQSFRVRHLADIALTMKETRRFLSVFQLDTEENICVLKKRELYMIMKNCYSLVHSGKATTEEMCQYFRRLRENPLISQSGWTLVDKRWNIADKLVLMLLRRQQRLLVWFLRFEKQVMRFIRR